MQLNLGNRWWRYALLYLSKPEHIFIIIALLFGCFFIRAVPPLWGLDEVEHFYRAFQVSDGKLGVYKTDAGYGGSVPAAAKELGLLAKYDLIDNDLTKPTVSRHDYNQDYPHGVFLRKSMAGKRAEVAFPNSAVYSPVGYLPAAIGIKFARIVHGSIDFAVYGARFVALAAWISIVYFAMRLVREKQKWLLFTVALLPVSLFQASVIGNDVLTNSLSLLFFAALLRIINNTRSGRTITDGEKVLVATVLIVLSAVKINYALLGLILLALPSKAFQDRKASYQMKLVWLACCALPALLWGIISRPVGETLGSLRGTDLAGMVNSHQQLIGIFSDPLSFLDVLARTFAYSGGEYFNDMVGLLGWNYVGIPLPIVCLCYGLLLTAALYLKQANSHRKLMLTMAGVAGVTILGVMTTLYLTFNLVHESTLIGFQARYILPVLPLLLYPLAHALPVNIVISRKNALLLFTGGAVLTLSISSLYYVLATY